MRRTKRSLCLVMFVAGAFAAGAVGGCVAESEPGPSLNPQPLPPADPPDDKHGGEETQEPPGTFDPGGADGTSSSSGGTSGSGSTDAGGN